MYGAEEAKLLPCETQASIISFCVPINHSSTPAFFSGTCIASCVSQQLGICCAFYCSHSETMVLPQKVYSLTTWWNIYVYIHNRNRYGISPFCELLYYDYISLLQKYQSAFVHPPWEINVLPVASTVIKSCHLYPSVQIGALRSYSFLDFFCNSSGYFSVYWSLVWVDVFFNPATCIHLFTESSH